jgi:hypothetical protein
MVKKWIIAVAALAHLAGCAPPGRDIECVDDDTCDRFVGGECVVYEESGRQWCSYPDEDCPSRRRWSDLDVGDGLEDMCMEVTVDAGADASGDATLASLAATVGVLEPAFDPAVTDYQLDVLLVEDLVAFTPTATVAAGVTITVDGMDVASGVMSDALVLAPGAREVDIVVVADGGAINTYHVHLRRGIDALAAIELSYDGGALANALSPTFDPTTDTYAVSVGLWVQRLQLTVELVAPESTVTVSGGSVPAGVPSLPTLLNLGLTSIPIVVTTTGGEQRTYTLNVTRASAVLQQAYTKASNTGAVDNFGASIAMWGDTLAVGAPGEDSAGTGIGADQIDNSASGSGAVYVFTRTGTAWVQQAYLKPPNTGAGDAFGNSIGLWGDTLAVGARGESSAAVGVGGNQADNSAAGSGAVYVFVRSGITWSQQAYVKASNTDATDAFGTSIALWGDTLAVGAVQEDSAATGVGGNESDDSATSSGAVYVFTRSGVTWSQQAYIKASTSGLGDRFGVSVALWDDTLAVGAYFEDSSAVGIGGNQADDSAGDAGAAYVFSRSAGTWSQQAYIKASNTGAGDYFGTSVALWDDTLVVGAPEEDSAATVVDGNQGDNTASGAGAAYVFVRTGATWSQQEYLKASNSNADDEFGKSVALWGNALAVGAWHESSVATGIGGSQIDNSADNAGAAYVFTRFTTSWTQQSYVKASNTNANDSFAVSVSLWGDSLAIGAIGESSAAFGVGGNQSDNSALASGAVYVVR